MKLNGTPLRSPMPATVRLAEAPIRVPLPPRHAPSDRHHQSGSICCGPPRTEPVDLISGIMVATKGMLSRIEERNADAHKMARPVAGRLPPVAATSLLARM